MIARIFIWMLLFIILPDVYLFRRLRGKKPSMPLWKQLLWWTPAVVMMVYTILLATIENFVPDDFFWIRLYLVLVGLFLIPKAVFSLCSFIGWAVRMFTGVRLNYGTLVGDVLSLACVALFFYGLLFGWRGLEVKHVDIYFDNLPQSFDGYRIAQFTDAHVGTFSGSSSRFLKRDIDSINALGADIIAFTGDIQNVQPSELDEFKDLFSSLRAKDGVYAILGNHDYSNYVGGSEYNKSQNEKKTRESMRSFGWNLLLNQSAVIKRGGESLYIAGEECDDPTAGSNHQDIEKTYKGIPLNAFVVCLQHNPFNWKKSLVASKPRAIASLTLSGHTHGGQLQILGLRPTIFKYDADYGLYEDNGRYLYVSGGIGGLVPFRIGVTPEIIVITLHRK